MKLTGTFQGAEDSPTKSTSSFFFFLFFFFFFKLSLRDRGAVRTLPDSPPSLLSGLWGACARLPPAALPVDPVEGHGTDWTFSCHALKNPRDLSREGAGKKGAGGTKKTAPHHFYLIALVWSYEAPRGRAKFLRLALRCGTECSRHQHRQNRCSFYCTYCIYWDSLKEKRELYEE